MELRGKGRRGTNAQVNANVAKIITTPKFSVSRGLCYWPGEIDDF
jgi:hypothetical protein